MSVQHCADKCSMANFDMYPTYYTPSTSFRSIDCAVSRLVSTPRSELFLSLISLTLFPLPLHRYSDPPTLVLPRSLLSVQLTYALSPQLFHSRVMLVSRLFLACTMAAVCSASASAWPQGDTLDLVDIGTIPTSE